MIVSVRFSPPSSATMPRASSRRTRSIGRYFWKLARPRLICTIPAESQSISRIRLRTGTIRDRSKLAMSAVCSAIARSGRTNRIREVTTAIRLTRHSAMNTATSSLSRLASICWVKSLSGSTVPTTQPWRPNGATE